MVSYGILLTGSNIGMPDDRPYTRFIPMDSEEECETHLAKCTSLRIGMVALTAEIIHS